MPVANVDTFEHDISEEIKHKEASLTDIASAGGDVSNLTPPQATTSKVFIILGILFVVVVLVAVGIYAFSLSQSAVQPGITTSDQTTIPQAGDRLLSVSPSMSSAVGEHVAQVIKGEYGYTLPLTTYSPVFAYMIRNEDEYADELAIALGEEEATTTVPFIFSDTTINNQNMRVGVSGERTVVYAFVNATTLLIATSTEGILALRGGILTK